MNAREDKKLKDGRQSRDTGTLGKAMAVLNAVAEADEAPRFTELLACIEQPRGTLHRQISNLVEEGLLRHRRDGSYELGLELLRLASHAWSNNDFRIIAAPHLANLHGETGETVHLGMISGHEIIYVDKVESKSAIRMHSQVGKASPLYCTGIGKAALASLMMEDRQAIMAAQSYYPYTETTLPSIAALDEEVAMIERLGIAFDREEHETGIHCVAATIPTGAGSIHAAVSVTAPVYRISVDVLESWAPLVKQAAKAIARDAETRLGPRRS